MPTKLPLRDFYEELVKTQEIINRKFMGWKIDRFYGDHFKDVKYAMRRPEEYARKLKPSELLVHERPVTLTYSRSNSSLNEAPVDQTSPVA
jgi:hypothetical protein